MDLGMLLIAAVLVLIGLILIGFIAKSLLRLLPAILVAVLVYLAMGSLLWAGITFLAVAVLMAVVRH
ncbi:MAG: hypothetical protein ACLFS6_07145 [Methanomassiliicoccales archaeon]